MLVSLLYSVSASTTYTATYDLNYSLWHGGPHHAQIRIFPLVIICQQSSSSAAASSSSSSSLLTAQQSHTCSLPSPAQTLSAAAYVSPVSHTYISLTRDSHDKLTTLHITVCCTDKHHHQQLTNSVAKTTILKKYEKEFHTLHKAHKTTLHTNKKL